MDSYCSIDSYLAEELIVPVIFNVKAEGLGEFLGYADSHADVMRHSKEELPLWLAKPLAEYGIVQILTPTIYGEEARTKLSDPTLICHNNQPFYYVQGIEVAELTHDKQLFQALKEAFIERQKYLLSQSINIDEIQSTKMDSLTKQEQRLCEQINKANEELYKLRFGKPKPKNEPKK